MMKLTAAVLAGMIASAAFAADAGLSPGDREFLNKAAQGNQMEVAAGKLAAQRALDPSVKQFGEHMISDHTAAQETLKKVADLKQMPLTDTLSDEEHEALGKLEGLNGTEFDKAYAKLMVKDHETDISEFEKAAKKAADADVKAYAEQTLPTLKQHLVEAKRLSSAAKKSS